MLNTKTKSPASLDPFLHWLYLSDPSAFAQSILGFPLDKTQAPLLRDSPHRVILNCTRQWGKSTITAAKAVHEAYFYDNRLVIVLSPSARQSAEFLRKAHSFLRKLGVHPRGDGQNGISLLLPNGSRIIGLPGNEDTIRGFSNVHLLIIDEAARVPDELYHAVSPMIAVSSGALWLISTPNGRQGFFYDTWTNGGPEWLRITVPASECPRIQPAHLEQQRRTMAERTFRQEYCCEFADSNDQLIPHAVIQRALTPYTLPILISDTSIANIDPPPPMPLPPGVTLHDTLLRRRFYIGIDFGKVLDHTAIVILEKAQYLTGNIDRISYERTKEIRTTVRYIDRIPLGTAYTDVVSKLARITRFPEITEDCRLIPDETGVGKPIVEMIRAERLGVPIYPVNITSAETPRTEGTRNWIPKRDIIMRLLLQFEGNALKIAEKLPAAQDLAKELAAMKVRITASGYESFSAAPSGQHDDIVMALALANWRAQEEKW